MRLASTEEEKPRRRNNGTPNGKTDTAYCLRKEGTLQKKISFCNLQGRVKNSHPFPILNSTVAAGAERESLSKRRERRRERDYWRVWKEGGRSKSLTGRFCCRVGPLYASPKGEQGFLFLPNHPLFEPTGYWVPKARFDRVACFACHCVEKGRDCFPVHKYSRQNTPSV